MTDPSSQPRLPIRTVSRVTGLSADTLRVWERRYGFPKPLRAESGLRMFTDDDLQRLTLIVRALHWGYRPSEIVHRSAADIEQLLARPYHALEDETGETPHVQPILAALKRDDIQTVSNGLRSAAATLGIKAFVGRVATPLLQRVGEAWQKGDLQIRHEHFLSEALISRVRQLLTQFDMQPGSPTILLTTLPGEQHTLGLQLAALYVAAEGAIPRLLGGQTPLPEIAAAALAVNADVVGISLSASSSPREALRQSRWLLPRLPATTEIWLGGLVTRDLETRDKRILAVPDWSAVERAVRRLRESLAPGKPSLEGSPARAQPLGGSTRGRGALGAGKTAPARRR